MRLCMCVWTLVKNHWKTKTQSNYDLVFVQPLLSSHLIAQSCDALALTSTCASAGVKSARPSRWWPFSIHQSKATSLLCVPPSLQPLSHHLWFKLACGKCSSVVRQVPFRRFEKNNKKKKKLNGTKVCWEALKVFRFLSYCVGSDKYIY